MCLTTVIRSCCLLQSDLLFILHHELNGKTVHLTIIRRTELRGPSRLPSMVFFQILDLTLPEVAPLAYSQM